MLINIVKKIKTPMNNHSWKLIAKYFGHFFHVSHNTTFQLKKHYLESLDPNLNQIYLTEKEKEFILYQKIKNKKLPKN
jgi:hypothetical protein